MVSLFFFFFFFWGGVLFNQTIIYCVNRDKESVKATL